MNIYESKRPVNSQNTPIYGSGEAGGIWSEQIVDKEILEYHKLIIAKESTQGITIEAYRNRFTKIVYTIAKWFEEREQKKTERLITDKSGKLKKA